MYILVCDCGKEIQSEDEKFKCDGCGVEMEIVWPEVDGSLKKRGSNV